MKGSVALKVRRGCRDCPLEHDLHCAAKSYEALPAKVWESEGTPNWCPLRVGDVVIQMLRSAP